MAYKIEEGSSPSFWGASMSLTIPGYSFNLYRKAIDSLKKELNAMGVSVSKNPYIFTLTKENNPKIDLLDVELVVQVDNPGVDTDIIQFKEFEAVEKMLRIYANEFADIHIGLAEWMHDNDYMADGDLRRIVIDSDEYVYDCPVRPSEN